MTQDKETLPQPAPWSAKPIQYLDVTNVPALPQEPLVVADINTFVTPEEEPNSSEAEDFPDTDAEAYKQEASLEDKLFDTIGSLSDIVRRLEKLELAVDGIQDRIALHNVKSSHKI